MVRIPVLGRLFWYVLPSSFLPNWLLTHSCRREFIALVASLILIFLEGLITVITLGLREALTDSSLMQLSDFLQPNPSYDSVTTDQKISSIYFPLPKTLNQDQNQGQSPHRLRAPRTLWIYVPSSDSMQKSMSCRQGTGICLGYIVSV